MDAMRMVSGDGFQFLSRSHILNFVLGLRGLVTPYLRAPEADGGLLGSPNLDPSQE